ncbi:MAG TPA: galactokinase [Verrucomicrobiae bacterium]|nr:galactokinase [Verrucomicrobiae bacterium]
MNEKQAMEEKFRSLFHSEPRVFRAPGRVNLIGEHTDYNDGFVMPAAIELSCWAAIGPRPDRKLVIYSDNFSASFEVNLDDLPSRPSGKWWDYPVGVALTLQRSGYSLAASNLYIRGDVPLGIGLSSSAAIEVCTGLALAEMSGHQIDRTRLALICQSAENEFVGARCGIMDQFVSAHGRAGHALFLDCRSLRYDLIPIPGAIRLVICDTTIRRELASSEYNTRRAECEEGVQTLARVLPNVRALRDVTLADLEQHRDILSPTIYRRCRHVVSENGRVLQAAAAFRSGSLDVLKSLMAESHRSLRDDYEVSCSELDLMVDLARQQKGVHGARMTGGGFGGCTVNLVGATQTEEFQGRVASAYQAATGLHANIYICEPSNGAEVVLSAGSGCAS